MSRLDNTRLAKVGGYHHLDQAKVTLKCKQLVRKVGPLAVGALSIALAALAALHFSGGFRTDLVLWNNNTSN